jgi:ribosomal protein S18 acetylase RimI-like enzyme
VPAASSLPDQPWRARDAAPADHAALLALNRELQAEERALRPSRIAPEALPASHLDALFARAAGGDGGLIVALHDGVACGFAAWREDADALEIEPAEVVITDLVVGRAHRRRGAARALVGEVVSRAQAKGFARVLVTTLNANGAALQAYDAIGFRPILTTLELTLRRSR